MTGLGFVLCFAGDAADPGDEGAVLDDERRAFLDAIGARVVHVLPAPADAADTATADTATADTATADTAAADIATADTATATADRVVDVDGSLLAQLAAAGHVAALVRPDHYLFGGVASLGELPTLIDDLRRQLTGGIPA